MMDILKFAILLCINLANFANKFENFKKYLKTITKFAVKIIKQNKSCIISVYQFKYAINRFKFSDEFLKF